MSPSLNLVVLRALDPLTLVRIYEALGCVFRQEQHGKGPLHHSCELGSIVLEIYPRQTTDEASAGIRLGFAVADLDQVLAAVIAAGGHLVSPAKTSPWGRRAVLIDSEGHKLELTEASPSCPKP